MRKEGLRRRGEGKVVRNTPTLPVNELGAQNAYNHIKMGHGHVRLKFVKYHCRFSTTVRNF